MNANISSLTDVSDRHRNPRHESNLDYVNPFGDCKPIHSLEYSDYYLEKPTSFLSGFSTIGNGNIRIKRDFNFDFNKQIDLMERKADDAENKSIESVGKDYIESSIHGAAAQSAFEDNETISLEEVD